MTTAFHKWPRAACATSLALVLLLASAGAAATLSPDDRVAALTPDLKACIAATDARLNSGNRAATELRDIAGIAHTRLSLRDADRPAEAARAVEMLRTIFATQDMDPRSPLFGSFPVTLEPDSKKELDNHLPFIAASLAPVFTGVYDDRLGRNFLAEARPHLRAFLGPLARFKISVDYANMFLMRCTSLLLLGEAVGDPDAAADGARQVHAWIEAVRKHGILEYDSPTYSPVQLAALLMAEAHVRDARAKADLQAAVDYLWTDLITNTLKGRDGFLGGPHSRDYDFVGGGGAIESFYYAAGVSDRLPGNGHGFKEGLRAYAALVEGARWPTPEVLKVAAQGSERVVRGPCGELPGQDRYAFYTDGVAIGSCSRYYSPYDKKLTAEFADPKLPEISVVADQFDSPFGKVKNKDAHGYFKPRHTKEFIAAVQEKGLALALLDLSPEVKRPQITSLATNVLLPARADALWLDGKRLSADASFDEVCGDQSVVVVREGNGAVAVRIFAADGLAGQKPSWHLKFDRDGPPAARLVAYHYSGPEKNVGGVPVRAGVLMLAGIAKSDDAALGLGQRLHDARLTSSFHDGNWAVDLADGPTTLSAILDCNLGQVAARAVNGRVYRLPTSLSINDVDVTATLLDSPTR